MATSKQTTDITVRGGLVNVPESNTNPQNLRHRPTGQPTKKTVEPKPDHIPAPAPIPAADPEPESD